MDGITPAANAAAPAGVAASPASSSPAASAPAATPAAPAVGTGTEPGAGSAPAPGAQSTPPEGTPSAQPAAGAQTEPDVTQTQAFAHRFSSWQDKFIADQHFQDVHGNLITNYRQYQDAMAEAQRQRLDQQIQQTTGSDPKAFREAVEQVAMGLPVVKAADELLRKTNRESQISSLETALKTIAPNVRIDMSRPDLGLPNAAEISRYMKAGSSIVDAFKLANFDTLLQTAASGGQQAAVSQITGAAQSSPGPLGAGATAPTYLTPDQVRQMSQSDIKKNMKLIDESMKHWKP